MLFRIILYCFCVAVVAILLAWQPKPSTLDVFRQLEGSWQGTLYFPGTKIGRPQTSEVILKISSNNRGDRYFFTYTYLQESSAKRMDTLYIKRDSNTINGKKIVRQYNFKNGARKIVTSFTDYDRSENARVEHRYTFEIGKGIFKRNLEVKSRIGNKWLGREVFSFTCIACPQ